MLESVNSLLPSTLGSFFNLCIRVNYIWVHINGAQISGKYEGIEIKVCSMIVLGVA